MRDLFPITQAIDLIEARLQDEVSVSDMAAAAGYSVYHFIRTFNQVVRHTPYDYLMRRRLSEAARQVISGRRKMIDIALAYRFNNPETFSRAFKRMFGVQPVQWREHGVIPRRSLMPAASRVYLEHLERLGSRRPCLVEMPPRTLVGLMAPLGHAPGAAGQSWRELGEYIRLAGRQGGSYFGVTSYLDEGGERAYAFAGYEASPDGPASLLVSQTLPGGRYIRFSHPAPAADLPFTLDYLYHTWLPQAGLQPAYPLEIVDFGAAPPWIEPPAQFVVWLPVR